MTIICILYFMIIIIRAVQIVSIFNTSVVSPHIHHTALCGCVLIPKSHRGRVVLQLLITAKIMLELRVRIKVFTTTFDNISAISWWSVLLVEETGVSGQKPPTCSKSRVIWIRKSKKDSQHNGQKKTKTNNNLQRKKCFMLSVF
jgi:hypothetical protein